MSKASDWLSSLNSNHVADVSDVLNFKKENPKKSSTKICITGGKGGVGKTSISLKMARELAYQGQRVLLIDCDYNLSNTAIKLGLPLTNTFFSLVNLEKTFEECLYQDGNFHLLSACNGSLDLFNSTFRLEEIIIDIINEHESDYDFILLDCPAGLQRESLTLSAYSDMRIFVVTPDRSSITDSYSLIKVLSKNYGIKENHLFVNMYHSRAQFSKVVKTLSETVENFLGCRTHILGGVRKINVNQNRFDEIFLGRGKNDLHQEFLKVVSKLTDEFSRSNTALGHHYPTQAENMKFTQLNA